MSIFVVMMTGKPNVSKLSRNWLQRQNWVDFLQDVEAAGSMLPGGNILLLDYFLFSHRKTSDAITNSCVCDKYSSRPHHNFKMLLFEQIEKQIWTTDIQAIWQKQICMTLHSHSVIPTTQHIVINFFPFGMMPLIRCLDTWVDQFQ